MSFFISRCVGVSFLHDKRSEVFSRYGPNPSPQLLVGSTTCTSSVALSSAIEKEAMKLYAKVKILPSATAKKLSADIEATSKKRKIMEVRLHKQACVFCKIVQAVSIGCLV